MKRHKEMDFGERQQLENSIEEGIKGIFVFTEEPHIELEDGTIIWIDEITQ